MSLSTKRLPKLSTTTPHCPRHARVTVTLEDGTQPALLFLDNGGDSVKAMYLPPCPAHSSSGANPTPRFLAVPNCVGFSAVGGDDVVGAHIQELPHFHGFIVRRPVADGYIVDASRQAQVWEYILQAFHINAEDEARTQVWLTVPHGAPIEVARALKQLLSQRFQFHSVVFVSATFLALLACESSAEEAGEEELSVGPSGSSQQRAADDERHGKRSRPIAAADSPVSNPLGHSLCASPGCGVVIDVGFSGTTILPYLDYYPVLSSRTRIDIGGKVLTNRLKEHLSFTQTNLLEDGWLVNHIKEVCCEAALTTPHRQPAAHTAVKYYLPAIPALYPLGCKEEELDTRLGGPQRRSDRRPRRRIKREDSDESGASAGEGAADSSSATAAVDRKVLPFLQLEAERTYIPGLLFAPADTGVQQAGIVQSTLHAIFEKGLMGRLSLLRALPMRRVCVCGGTSQFPGFLARLERELRAALPSEADEAAATLALQPSPQVPARRRPQKKEGSLIIEGEGIGTVVRDGSALLPLRGAAWLLATGAGVELKGWVASRSLCHLRGQQEALFSDIHDALENML